MSFVKQNHFFFKSCKQNIFEIRLLFVFSKQQMAGGQMWSNMSTEEWFGTGETDEHGFRRRLEPYNVDWENLFGMPRGASRGTSHWMFAARSTASSAAPSTEPVVSKAKVEPKPKPKALPDVKHDRVASDRDQPCAVCLENVVAIMLRPCCHAQLCRTCFVGLKKRNDTVQCPSCRKESTDFDVIFL